MSLTTPAENETHCVAANAKFAGGLITSALPDDVIDAEVAEIV